MDSMRTLNTSLPKAPRKQPPEQLLSVFKAAALSVTNLYKTAASDQDQARKQGYQEALDELLHFLDKESLGFGDGEGWKVRQWATERYDGSPPVLESHESDDDKIDMGTQVRGSPPAIQRKLSREALSARHPTPSSSPTRMVSTTSQTLPPVQESNEAVPKPGIFSFTTPIPYPQEVEMQVSEPSDDPNQASQTQTTPNAATPTLRVGVVSRGARTPHRSVGTRSTRHNTRSTHSAKSLGPGAGSKRGISFGEFFDIGGSGDRDSLGGGGKKGRTG
ncbi:MAG: hypothetical protein HETSPECPRED_002245 [Heterodermia speciosa]|uniref:Uncharacterized protein n=1 Tax=Heterodermia speciosa TaxID=116794 RepID=A0A8H3F624_9LECA|nr:MAG: hypothetical protein HETSPECPRED_002245 [Heterodermia speciosa]